MSESPPGDRVNEELWRVIQGFLRANRALADTLGMSPNDLAALQHIMGKPGIGPRHIAELLDIKTASSTVLIERLEAAGHVVKRPHPEDGRRLMLEATDKAHGLVTAHLAPLFQDMGALVGSLSQESRETISSFLAEAADLQEKFAAALEEK